MFQKVFELRNVKSVFSLLFLLGVALFLSSAIGCQGQKTAAPANQANSTKKPTIHKNPAEFEGSYWTKKGFKIDSGWKPVTSDESASEFGNAFEAAIKSKNAQQSASLLYMKPLYDRAVDGVSLAAFKKGFAGAWRQATDQLIANMSVEGSQIKFVGVRESPAGPGALMRVLNADGSCVYQLWYLVTDNEGKPRALDAFIFFAGENLSETVRRLALLSVPRDDRTFVEKLTGKELEFSKNQETLLKLLEANSKKDFDGVLAAYNQLPASLQKEKFTMMLKVAATMQMSNDELYVKALEEYQEVFPNDASIDLVSLDLNFLKRRFDKVHESMTRLEQTIGVDGHLRTLRASAYYEEGKIEEAIKYAEKAIAIQEDLDTPHFLLTALYSQQGKFDEAVKVLRKLVTDFEYIEFDHSDPVFAELLKSKEYAEFERFRKQQLLKLQAE